MANVNQQIVWSDIDFVQDSQGRLKKLINVESVIRSIDNILRTNRGERWGLPQFGTNLSGLLQENMTDTIRKFATQEIKESVEMWDDRVIISEVRFESDPDNKSVNIVVLFLIKSLPNIFQHKITVQ